MSLQIKKPGNIILILIMVTIFSFASAAFAGTYWVDDNGDATWADCTGSTSLNGASACTLATANSNAVAGDLVYLRGGTYNTNIAPSNSGNSGNVITYKAYTGETPVLTPTISQATIFLDGKDYIKIDGITIKDGYMYASIRNGSDYNEIVNCTFTDTDGKNNSKGLKIWGQCSGGTPNNCHSTNNWIHNNIISRNGWVGAAPTCQDEGGTMHVGTSASGDGGSNYNTVEDNEFFAGGHHLIEISSKYNVVRNNVFHNEGWMTDPGGCDWGPSPRNGKYGNRNLSINNWHDTDGLYLLVENNRTGHTAFASDGGMDGGKIGRAHV